MPLNGNEPDWGYQKKNGPHLWSDLYPLAGGHHQSPIDIRCKEAYNDDVRLNALPLRFHYAPDICKSISNIGFGWKAEVKGAKTLLECGPLKHRYQLEQFHSHWGRTDDEGSEHTVDGRSYAAELHLVHWNTDLYANFAEAVAGENGLAVLGIFFEVSNTEEHEELGKLCGWLKKITHKGQDTEIYEQFNIAALLPEDKSYWTYQGSLTTPPFNETVTWIVFKHPIRVSKVQLAKFRELRRYRRNERCPVEEEAEDGGCCTHNYRPPVTATNRNVRFAFDLSKSRNQNEYILDNENGNANDTN